MENPNNRPAGDEKSMVERYLVPGAVVLLVLSSVFQGAAIFSFTTRQGFTAGVAPYWLIVALSLLVTIPAITSRQQIRSSLFATEIRTASLCLLAFAAYGVASAFTLPFVFDGIRILDPRLGMDNQYLNPSVLHWGLSNAGQAGYMLLNLGALLLLLVAGRTARGLAFAGKVLAVVACLVLGFAFFQHLSVAYVPNTLYQVVYASSHNNPGLFSYPMLDPRTTSFFLEPSYFAGYAMATLFAAMIAYLYSGGKWWLGLSSVALYAVLTSQSSIGVLLLPSGLVLTAAVLALRHRRERSSRANAGALSRLPVVLIVQVAVFIFFSQEPAVADLLRRQAPRADAPFAAMAAPVPSAAVESTPRQSTGAAAGSTPEAPGNATWPPSLALPSILTPGSRTWDERLLSATYRLWADEFSIVTVAQETWLLGAGLGSNRPSSFLAYVVSNMGLPGLVAFGAFVFLTARSFIRNVEKLSPSVLAISLGFFVYLLAMLSGLPDPSWPPFLWIFAALTLAGIAESAEPTQN